LGALRSDITIFGRSRVHIWRGVFNLLEEVSFEGIDVSPWLSELRGFIPLLFLVEEKINALNKVSLFYHKYAKKSEEAYHVLLESYEQVESIRSTVRRCLYLTEIADYAFQCGFNELGERIIDEILNYLIAISSPYDRALILINSGVALAKYDVGRGDSLIMSAVELAERCGDSTCYAKVLGRAASSLISISDDNENVRIAKNWFGKAFRIIYDFNIEMQLSLLAEIIGDVAIWNESKALELFQSLITKIKPDKFGIEIMLKAAKSLVRSDSDDLLSKVLNWLETRIPKSQFISKYEQLYYFVKTEAFYRYVDSYKVRFILKYIVDYIENALIGVKKSTDKELLKETIKKLAELDLEDAYNSFKKFMISECDKCSSPLKLYNKKIEFLLDFKDVFPKQILQEAIGLLREINNSPREYKIDLLPKQIPLFQYSERDFKNAAKCALALYDEISNKLEKIRYFSRVCSAIISVDPNWGRVLIEYALEEIENLSKVDKAQALIFLSEQIYPCDAGLSRRILRDAIKTVESCEEERAAELMLEISKKAKNLFGDDGWARQIEILAHEMRRKKRSKN